MSKRFACSITALALLASASHGQKTEIRLDSGTLPGVSKSELPVITAAGSTVYVAWSERPHQEANGDIYLDRSLDGGATWLPDALRLNRGSPIGAADSLFPEIAAEGAAVYVTWMDARSGNYDIYFDRSLDRGTTWLPAEVCLDECAPGAGYSTEPKLAVEGSTVHVVWGELGDIHHRRSLDGGLTWEPSARLDTDPVPNLHASRYHQLVVKNGAVYVAWADSRNGNPDVYFNRSLDGGAHWLASDVRLDVGSAPGAALSDGVALVATDSSVVVAWLDWRYSPAGTIYSNRSLDGGSTWLAVDQRLDLARAPTDGGVSGPTLAASDTTVYAAWSENRAAASFNHDIAFNRSLDGGTTWSLGDQHLNHHEPGQALAPRLAAVGSSVYALWSDRQSGTERNLYFNRSLNEGATWLPVDVRLSDGRAQFYPSIAVSGGSVYAAWPDGRDGEPDVYFNIALGSQPYGTGLAGSGGFVPTLACSGNASIGAVLQVDVADGRGAANGVLLLGLEGPASRPAFGGTLLVRPPLFQMRFSLAGATGAAGAGSASIPLSIPYSLWLLGRRVSFQALVGDPGAPGHVAMSAAVETWIL